MPTTIRLRPEIKQQWAAKLRSGEYRQGEGSLHSRTPEGEDFFCCLGVLCDLAVKAGVLNPPLFAGFAREVAYYGAENADALPPREVANWAFGGEVPAGFDWKVPYPLAGGEAPTNVELADLNDSYDLPFAEIADLIEKGL